KDGLIIINYDEKKIPCILLNDKKFNELMKNYYNKSMMVDSRFDIWHDDKGNVFVNIILEFEDYEVIEALLYANESIQFFEALAEYGIIALMSANYSSNILMVQLAKKERMEEALENIKRYMNI
ncbi:MAG: hypothetical protein QW050_02170, partial [Candidatus Nitrosocaldaceae archaeon]